jgi:hypothetical protein
MEEFKVAINDMWRKLCDNTATTAEIINLYQFIFNVCQEEENNAAVYNFLVEVLRKHENVSRARYEKAATILVHSSAYIKKFYTDSEGVTSLDAIVAQELQEFYATLK